MPRGIQPTFLAMPGLASRRHVNTPQHTPETEASQCRTYFAIPIKSMAGNSSAIHSGWVLKQGGLAAVAPPSPHFTRLTHMESIAT